MSEPTWWMNLVCWLFGYEVTYLTFDEVRFTKADLKLALKDGQ